MANPALDALRKAAEKYPGAEQAFLFGDHEVYRVKGKVFLWLGDTDDGGTWVGVKLKDSQAAALSLPFVEPMEYGMAKWGWVGAEFAKGKKVPMPLVLQWLEESYRHTAPKKLLQQWQSGGAPKSASKPAAKRKAPAKKRAQRSA